MTCRTPTTSDRFVPEKRLPQAAASDAEVPPLQAEAVPGPWRGKWWHIGACRCPNLCAMGSKTSLNPLLGCLCHGFLKKKQPQTPKFSLVLSWQQTGFMRAPWRPIPATIWS